LDEAIAEIYRREVNCGETFFDVGWIGGQTKRPLLRNPIP